MSDAIQVGERMIGHGYPVYIIAEMSANHGQDFERAVKIVHAAKEAGADAIKLQTFKPECLTLDSDNDFFKLKTTIWDGRTLYDLYSETHTPWEWHVQLKMIANDIGLDFFSTPFDFQAVDFLEKLDVPAYKIASFEIVDLELLTKIAETGKPIILSTGMATIAEIDEAVRTIENTGNHQYALLKCTSSYPAIPEEMNLASISRLRTIYGQPVGLSDHTLDSTIPVVAVSIGASIVEKHLTLSRRINTPDSAFSSEPLEFKQLITKIRLAEKALGNGHVGPLKQEENSLVFRRSLFVVKNMQAGDLFDTDNVKSIRPGFGLHPRYLKDALGRHASRDIERATPLSWELIAN